MADSQILRGLVESMPKRLLELFERVTLYIFFLKIPGFVLIKPSWDWDWVNYSGPGRV